MAYPHCTALSLCVVVTLALSPTLVCAQTVRARDPTPLERPQPLLVARGPARALLQQIYGFLEQDSFAVEKVNWNDAELQASRPDTRSARPALDRVIVWLEGSLADTSQVKVYLAYGRYETFLGSTDPQRALIGASEERDRIGKLRQRILAAGAGR